ncbi:PH domain-containing protein [Mesorhizobium sp. M0954]|uniref:PH domain-containing protein n=1 Tax=Mesorhizobium sp. M0954 TaxID=2957032 RepID=UPI00333B4256
MRHIDYFRMKKSQPGEIVSAHLDGWIGKTMGKGDGRRRNGTLVVTNHRAAFLHKGIFGEIFETIPIEKISSVETRSVLGYRLLKIHTSHDHLTFKTFADHEAFGHAVAMIKTTGRGAEVRRTSDQTSLHLASELKELAALRTAGALSGEEYELAKGHVLRFGSLHNITPRTAPCLTSQCEAPNGLSRSTNAAA